MVYKVTERAKKSYKYDSSIRTMLQAIWPEHKKYREMSEGVFMCVHSIDKHTIDWQHQDKILETHLECDPHSIFKAQMPTN